jgi:hypothetical protein
MRREPWHLESRTIDQTHLIDERTSRFSKQLEQEGLEVKQRRAAPDLDGKTGCGLLCSTVMLADMPHFLWWTEQKLSSKAREMAPLWIAVGWLIIGLKKNDVKRK